jgi:hypothetical protein
MLEEERGLRRSYRGLDKAEEPFAGDRALYG